jgi:type II secretory pathway pseudopilin PulG
MHRIIVGIVLVIAVTTGLIKHYTNRRKSEEMVRWRNALRATEMDSRKNLAGRKLEEGEGSFENPDSRFRESAQPISNSRTLSYVSSPSTAAGNWGNSKSIDSASSSNKDLPRFRDGNNASLPSAPQPAKKSSPLRPNPFDLPFSNTTRTISSIGEPSPVARPAQGFTNPQGHRGWVSPLDVYFSRPRTPPGPLTRPQSYLPRLQFTDDTVKSALLVSTPVDPVRGAIHLGSRFNLLPRNLPE